MDKRAQEIKELKKQMQAIADQIQSMTEDEVDSFQDQASDYLKQAKDRWEDVSGQFRDGFETAKKQTRRAIRQADDFAHDNPWVTVAAAAAAGVLVGLMVSRNDRGDDY